MAFAAKIVVDAALEAETAVALTPLTVGHVIAPVVAHGKPVQGKLTISGPKNASFTGLKLAIHVFGSYKEGDAWTTVSLGQPVAVPLKLEADKTYSLDASGSVEVPFVTSTAALPLADSLGVAGTVVVQHELEVTLTPASSMGSRPLRVTHPLAVQTLKPLPTENPTGSWFTVGDFGGECKIVLTNGATDTWAVGSTIEGELTIGGTGPLARAKVLLLASVNGGEPTTVKEVVVWEAKDTANGSSPQGSFPVRVPLSMADGATPSVAASDDALELSHSLRLHVDSADAVSGWNSLPITLCAGATLQGAKKGSLAPPEPVDAKKRVTRPLPKPKFVWLKRLLAVVLMIGLVLGADYGAARMEGEDVGFLVKHAAKGLANGRTMLEDLMVDPKKVKELEAKRNKEQKERQDREMKREARKQAKEALKDVPKAQLVQALAQAGVDVDEDDMSEKELKEMAVKRYTTELMKHAKEEKMAKEMGAKPPPSKEEKMKKLLKRKQHDEIRVMLYACEIEFDDNATTKELRDLAMETNVLEKWDALAPTVKLKWNQQLAIAGARAHKNKENQYKAEREARKEAYKKKMREEKGMMWHMAPKPEWEVEWDSMQEEEALERLSRLPMFKTMDPAMLERMMDGIRKNPAMLDMLEGETKQTEQMAAMMGPGGEMPSLQQMKEAGMDFDMHTFDENIKKAEVESAPVASA